MLGQTAANNYTRQGPITAYTGSVADVEGRRSLLVSPAGLVDFAPYVAANLCSSFRGTDCLPIVDRLAYGQYEKQKRASEAVGAYLTEQKLMRQFSQQTGDAIARGRQTLGDARRRSLEFRRSLAKFRREFVVAGTETADVPAERRPSPTEVLPPFPIPEIWLQTDDTRLAVFGAIVGTNQLAATSPPPHIMLASDVSLQLHESLVANFIAPALEGRTLYSNEFARKAEAFLDEVPAGLQFQGDEGDIWSITFANARPVQFEFDNNRIRVTVSGRQFERGERYREAMLITLQYQIRWLDGKLKLVREGQAVVDFATPGQKNAREIAFKTFLQDQLNKSMQGDPLEQAVDLPDNLIPVDRFPNLQDPQRLRDLQLVELHSDQGWLTLGWNYAPAGPNAAGPVYTPMITP
jgi:hypothetical protein